MNVLAGQLQAPVRQHRRREGRAASGDGSPGPPARRSPPTPGAPAARPERGGTRGRVTERHRFRQTETDVSPATTASLGVTWCACLTTLRFCCGRTPHQQQGIPIHAQSCQHRVSTASHRARQQQAPVMRRPMSVRAAPLPGTVPGAGGRRPTAAPGCADGAAPNAVGMGRRELGAARRDDCVLRGWRKERGSACAARGT